MVASAAMAGVPLFNGFLSKEMFFAETLGVTALMPFGWALPAAVTLAGVFAVAYSVRFIHDVFFNGEPIDLPKTPHEPPRWMKVPVEVLVALCLLVGIAPALTVSPSSPSRRRVSCKGLSRTTTWPSGTASARPVDERHRPDRRRPALPGPPAPLYPAPALGRAGAGTGPLRRALGARLCPGPAADRAARHRLTARMLFVFVLAALVLGGAGFLGTAGGLTGPRPLLPLDGVSLLAGLGLMAAAVAVVLRHRERLVALILMGAVGLVVALAFVRFSAPDLP